MAMEGQRMRISDQRPRSGRDSPAALLRLLRRGSVSSADLQRAHSSDRELGVAAASLEAEPIADEAIRFAKTSSTILVYSANRG